MTKTTMDEIRARADRWPSSSAQVSDETLVLLAILDRLEALEIMARPPRLLSKEAQEIIGPPYPDLHAAVSYLDALHEPIAHFGEPDDSALENLK